MTHMNSVIFPSSLAPMELVPLSTTACHATVVVVSDSAELASVLDNISDFLGFDIEMITTHDDLGPVLLHHRPMAVVAELDGDGQDGCHVMMVVADHDPGLPLLLLTGHEPSLIGAADAVEELWQLTAVTKAAEMPGIGQLVEFLFQAGRRGNCIRLMPA